MIDVDRTAKVPGARVASTGRPEHAAGRRKGSTVQIPLPRSVRPWSATAITEDDLTPLEVASLRKVYAPDEDGRGLAYGSQVTAHAKRLSRMAHLGLVEFTDAKAGGWETGMWGARLTCVGANAVFRIDAEYLVEGEGKRDVHPGCGGYWLLEGECSKCQAFRPLDLEAYGDYLVYLEINEPDEHARQISGPQLWCTEHGYMRARHITTTKVCHQPGTHLHDGGLVRMAGMRFPSEPYATPEFLD